MTLRVNEIPSKTFTWTDAFPVMKSGDATAWAGVIIAAMTLVVGFINKDKIRRFLKGSRKGIGGKGRQNFNI